MASFKVRALESTIDGLRRSMGAQGADLGSLEEASIGSEIPKLQQELHELYHGTPEHITEKMNSPAVITKSARKRLWNERSSTTLETEIGEAGTGYKKVAVEEKGATDAGRSGKRPKLQIRGGKCRNNSH